MRIKGRHVFYCDDIDNCWVNSSTRDNWKISGRHNRTQETLKAAQTSAKVWSTQQQMQQEHQG
ncbi:MAG: hypothetical protein ACK55Z_26885, partial [bacterium]